MADDAKFEIVFSGEIASGFLLADVKQKVSHLFKLDVAKVEKLFVSKAVVLKKDLSEAAALKYQKILLQAGMLVALKPMGEAPSQPPTEDEYKNDSPRNMTQDNTAFDGLGAYAAPVSEPLVSDPLVSEPSVSKSAPSSSPDLSPTLSSTLSATQKAATSKNTTTETDSTHQTTQDKSPQWEIAEVGVRLSEQSQTEMSPLKDVDLTLAPQQGHLLQPEERAKEVAPPILESLDEVTLSAIGADLLQASEKLTTKSTDISTDHLSLAEVKGDLLKPEEKKALVENNIDTSGIQLVDDNE